MMSDADIDQVVGKSSARLGIQGEEDIALSATHVDMCRFPSRDDVNYKLVSKALIRAAQKTLERVEDQPQTPTHSMICTSTKSQLH